MPNNDLYKKGIIHLTFLLCALFFFLGLFYNHFTAVRDYTFPNGKQIDFSCLGYVDGILRKYDMRVLYPVVMFVIIGITISIPIGIWIRYHEKLDKKTYHYLFAIHLGGFPFFMQNFIAIFVISHYIGKPDIYNIFYSIVYLLFLGIYILFIHKENDFKKLYRQIRKRPKHRAMKL